MRYQHVSGEADQVVIRVLLPSLERPLLLGLPYASQQKQPVPVFGQSHKEEIAASNQQHQTLDVFFIHNFDMYASSSTASSLRVRLSHDEDTSRES